MIIVRYISFRLFFMINSFVLAFEISWSILLRSINVAAKIPIVVISAAMGRIISGKLLYCAMEVIVATNTKIKLE